MTEYEERMRVNRAHTILNQLTLSHNGSSRLKVMIGAYNFIYTRNGVIFRFKARATNGANFCEIDLDPEDTYTMRFKRIWGMKVTDCGEFSGLYFDKLKGCFERETGLVLSL